MGDSFRMDILQPVQNLVDVALSYWVGTLMVS